MDSARVRSFLIRHDGEGPSLDRAVKRREQYGKAQELLEKLRRATYYRESTGLITVPRRCTCPKCDAWHWTFFFPRELLDPKQAAELAQRAETERYATKVLSIEEAFTPPCQVCERPLLIVVTHVKDGADWRQLCLECPSVDYVGDWRFRNLERYGSFEVPKR